MNRQEQLLKMWNNHKKAIVVNGHGVLSNARRFRIVPPDVALMFLAEPGTCMNINTGLGVQNKFFTSASRFRNFLTGGRSGGVQYKHVTNILSRTHLPGDRYPNMNVQLEPNATYPTMGFIKKIPMRHSRAVPTFKETVGPLKPKMYTLSKLLRGRKGIVVVSACRENPNVNRSRSVLNLPTNAYRFTPRKKQPRGTRYSAIIRATPMFKPRPGVTWLSMVQPKTSVFKKKGDRTKVLRKLRTIVYGKPSSEPFRKLLSRLKLPANITLKKEFELLKRHWKKPPGNVTVLRSGKPVAKNVS
jgi:hypothetical protein